MRLDLERLRSAGVRVVQYVSEDIGHYATIGLNLVFWSHSKSCDTVSGRCNRYLSLSTKA